MNFPPQVGYTTRSVLVLAAVAWGCLLLLSLSRCGPGETTLPNSASAITAACDGIRVSPLPGSYPSPLTVTAQSCDGSPIKAGWHIVSGAILDCVTGSAPVGPWQGFVSFYQGGTEAEGAPHVEVTAAFNGPTGFELTFGGQSFRYDVP
jgi:hypothetical protein